MEVPFPSPKPIAKLKEDAKKVLGLTFVLGTAVIWVVSSFLSEFLVSPSSSGGKAAVSPFLLTFLATTLFTLYLPLIHIKWWVLERQAHKAGPASLNGGRSRQAYSPLNASLAAAAVEPSQAKASHWACMMAALWCCPPWFAAQLAFNASLARTSVTSNTILSSTSSLFTFGLSLLLLHERYTSRKLLCIFACIAGTAFVTLSDSYAGVPSSSNMPPPSPGVLLSDGLGMHQATAAYAATGEAPLVLRRMLNSSSLTGGAVGVVFGDFLVVLSAALYAGYTVVMRQRLPSVDDDTDSVALFFGYLGLITTAMLSPILVVLLSSGTISLSTIPRSAYAIILLEGLLDYVLADYLWARSVMLLGPTVATLSLSIQIPIAGGADLVLGKPAWIRGGPKTVLMTLAGTGLILLGFVGVNVGSSYADAAQISSDNLPGEGGGLLGVTEKDKDSGDEDLAGVSVAVGGWAQEHGAGTLRFDKARQTT